MAVVSIGDRYQARPVKGFRCWQLFERVDKTRDGEPLEVPGWRALESYPSTLAHAVEIVAERDLKALEGVIDLPEAMDRLEGYARDVREVG